MSSDAASDFDEADVKLIEGASMVHSLRCDKSIKTEEGDSIH